ncbi:MAG: acetoacetate--CoA ligase [Hamadaea sp.]|uniref:acetoacetate--CoA ligase n=1 Tax=Hamadaea sp. TaxID=2024425 RepID=UPI0017CEA6AE|nr:acetoacetate--CoA ligase [Hamadaea sp.]NUR72948.1 acetoacetate--CoA ligase [Hamadaea sp.]NUT21751.1 acetoacetate--CoA ligase [Hamadaea sp.]
MTTILWRPPADVRQTSRIGDYLRWLSAERGRDFDAYAELWQWSVEDLPGFWRSIWDYFGVVASTESPEVVSNGYTSGAPFGPGTPFGPTGTWFPGARLNYAENVLRMPGVAGDTPIVFGRSQSREPVVFTADELRDQVRRAAAGLRRLGVQPGDRVAAYLPNVPEALILLLATASLGAIFTSCAPEFGTRSVTDRWTQISPVVLVAVDGYRYGDKLVDRRAEVAGIRAALPSVRATVGLDYTGQENSADLSWAELTADTDEPLTFAQVAFDQPLYILYSSGTTGLPKPIVHGHGGILLEHLKMLALHHDLGPGDRMFWFSTTGWMMWNYLVSAPAVGSAIVMYDGNPGWPDLGALWRMAEETETTFFGTSAPFLLACRKAGLSPKDVADLSRLKGLGSTGAPLPPEGFRWVYTDVSDTLQLQSLSGGTDVCTGFVGSTPLNPVYEGEIAARCLGARVEAYDPTGKPVLGELGELVISAPMPSMPVGFWGDDDGSRYREAYFDVFPGVWRHGDWVTIADHGSCVITGRSDATLNRGGVRLGTAEFYSVVEALDEVVDSVVVHLEDTEGGAGELLLFVVLQDGLELDDTLRAKIARELRTALSPRHIPDAIYQVTAAPRTLSGKKLEVPVKRILTGTPVDRAAAKGALANPESLSAFEKLARERPH